MHRNLVFKCIHEGCSDRIRLCDYSAHLTKHCKVRTYPRALPIQDECKYTIKNPRQLELFTKADDFMKNPYHGIFDCYDLQILFFGRSSRQE